MSTEINNGDILIEVIASNRLNNLREFVNVEVEAGKAKQRTRETRRSHDRKYGDMFYFPESKGGSSMEIQFYTGIEGDGGDNPDKIRVKEGDSEVEVKVMARIWSTNKKERKASCVEIGDNGKAYITWYDTYRDGDPNNENERGLTIWSAKDKEVRGEVSSDFFNSGVFENLRID